ncbi:MAG: hypothetical protein HWE13_01645 [Gammaproteobacteria bacterium]|nr:hypothetical protein [Gammaproteobacteria bacterium]NVK86794.1 hypothetical protein [Gammaproteobacteria bacterium]
MMLAKKLFIIAIGLLLLSETLVAAKPSVQQHFQSPGKSQVPIGIEYEPFKRALQVGEQVDLTVRFTFPENFSTINVGLENMAPRVLNMAKTSSATLKSSDSGRSAPLNIRFTVAQEGIAYLGVTAQVMVDGVMKSRAFAIPVVVGKANWEAFLAPHGQLQRDDTGRLLLLQDAQETVNQ